MAESITFRSAMNGFHRGEVLEYIKKILEDKAAIELRLSQSEEMVRSLEAENASLQEKLAQADRRKDPDEIEKLNAQQLGKAMFDARRYSDLIVSEAKATAEEMFADAKGSAKELSGIVEELTEKTTHAQEDVRTAMTEVLSVMEDLYQRISAFAEEAGLEGESFLKKFWNSVLDGQATQ